MSQNNVRTNRRVWVSAIAASIGIGSWLVWHQTRLSNLVSSSDQPQSFVQLAGGGKAESDQVLREKAQLMDPTPLFFPTEWNFGQQPLSAGNLKQPGQVFVSFDAKFTVGEQKITHYGATAPTLPEKLSDVLGQGNEAPFAGFGEQTGRNPTLPVRSGFLEVRELNKSEYVISQSLSGINSPRSDFPPIEFIVVVGSTGLIGEPILTGSSGWDDVDLYFRSYLVKSYRLGERLPPGRYRVLVGA